MTDRFNRKAQEILAASTENGGLTLRSLFDLQVAAHDESVEVARILTERIEQQCDVMDEKFAALDCVKNPRQPRRNYDEPDTDFAHARKDEDRHLWVIWNVAVGIIRYLALPIVVGVVVAVLLTLIFTGTV
jgi:hypothetical protein